MKFQQNVSGLLLVDVIDKDGWRNILKRGIENWPTDGSRPYICGPPWEPAVLDLPNCKAIHAEGVKCPRCGHWHMVSVNWDNWCDRCCRVFIEEYPDHEYTFSIKEAYRVQRERWHVGEYATK